MTQEADVTEGSFDARTPGAGRMTSRGLRNACGALSFPGGTPFADGPGRPRARRRPFVAVRRAEGSRGDGAARGARREEGAIRSRGRRLLLLLSGADAGAPLGIRGGG